MYTVVYTKKQEIISIIQESCSTWKKSVIKAIPLGLIDFFVSCLIMQLNNQEHLGHITNYCISQCVVYGIILLVTHISTIYLVNKCAINKSISLSELVKIGLKKCLALLVILSLIGITTLIISAPMLLLILKVIPSTFLNSKLLGYLCYLLAFMPSIIINIYIMPSFYLLIIDGTSVIKSVKNSFYLVSGSWWYMFVAFLIIVTINQMYTLTVGNQYKATSFFKFVLTSFPYIILISPFIHSFVITIIYKLKGFRQK